ncbi:MAG: hypothetical protein KIT70_03770 [Anaerolineales bacterium]|nr:MAG: hypothetical protein KIT70_03770 [Anaerolineales bacterium]
MIPADLLAQAGIVVAAALTLVTLSYIFGDHPVFRVVLHIFIGAAAGYAGAIAVQDVIFPQLIFPAIELASGASTLDTVDVGMRLGLSALLLTKLSPRTARFGNPVTAMLVGVGAALAIGGAIQSTLLPQINSSAQIFDVAGFDLALQGGYYGESLSIVLQGMLALLAMVSTLAYFHFGAEGRGKQTPQRNILVDVLAWAGSVFIAITLATLFSGVLLSSMGALTERLDFLYKTLSVLLGTP